VLTMTTENHFYRPLERHQIRSFHRALKLSVQLNRKEHSWAYPNVLVVVQQTTCW
jgi:hypothetical protein